MEKFTWRGFEFPAGCLLNDEAKNKLIQAAKMNNIDPFYFCRDNDWRKCPGSVHLACFKQALRKRDQKYEK